MASKDLKLKIEGMSCGGCESSVRRAVERLPGVSAREVSASGGSALIRFDEEQSAAEDIVTAIGDAGYDVAPGWSAVPAAG
jgi:copper chaperone